ncbi:hypothetical protein CPB84DRAFT_1712444 [Gymnopilus junonius]|uniref:Elongator complex protein 5 n=1 Tax=Gymnopilus junonius TaxID=109634 RepID=A0A9P5TK90_GYMJU|nr:hypothetical protein CPB84DRAFT_1712444 [Gymnopilus junonius]
MTFFPPFNLPQGIFLLITDALASPADFVLHRCLSAHLKEISKTKSGVEVEAAAVSMAVAILSVSESMARWKGVAGKSNVNLQSHIEGGSVEVINVFEEAQPRNANGGRNGDEERLKGVIERLRVSLARGDPVGGRKGEGEGEVNETSPGMKLVILDDISMLEWVGFDTTDVVRFARALRSVCTKANATLLVRHHIVTPGEPDEVFRHLLQLCTYHLEVLPLASGRSGSVSGEVALHPGFSAPKDGAKLIPRSAALQYRLTDTGAEFFAKGTSESVL